MTNNFRALCAELIASWDADGCDWKPQHQARWEATVNRARAALAEPECREPAAVAGQPSDEEVAELAAWLQEEADDYECIGREDSAAKCNRAAELLQRQAPQPPADGEVVEVVEWLHTVVAAYKSCRNTDHIWSLSGNGVNARLTVTLLTRAAELLQRQVLPEVGE